MSALRVLLWLFCCKGFYRSCDFGLEILGKLAGLGRLLSPSGACGGFSENAASHVWPSADSKLRSLPECFHTAAQLPP